MPNPSSAIRRSARRLRRPSPSMAVAGVALFMSLGGAGYAATNSLIHTNQIHNWAVTNAKIANNAVTFNKIKPSSVGVKRIVKSQVQLRLQNACATGQAMTAVDINGKVTCAPAMPGELNSAPAAAVAVSSPTTAATVSSLSLPAGSAYSVQANPYITVTPSTNNTAVDQHVVVTCTLKSGTAAAQRSASFDLPAVAGTPAPQVQTTSIPLVVMAPSSATAATATDVSCVTSVTDTSGANAGHAAANPATVSAQGQIYATQLASATTSTTTTPATTTTTATTTTPAP